MTTRRLLLLFCLTLLASASRHAALRAADTFRNPVLWADVPDPDVLRVGDTYYMVSTTMHLMPGAPIMKSHDLVHWQTVSYIFPRLTDSPKYSMQGGTVYGRGQWATSLQYHKGRFYALFAPNDKPGGETYIYVSEEGKVKSEEFITSEEGKVKSEEFITSEEGKVKSEEFITSEEGKVKSEEFITSEEGKVKSEEFSLLSRLPHFHDAALFFDDDDRAYVIYGTGEMVELTGDLRGVVPNSHRKLFERDTDETGLLEGSRMVKHDGKYYLLMISWPKGHPRREVCYRADSIQGPYEKRVILETEFQGFGGVGQGTIVEATDGQWYGLIFQDRGGMGRVPCLMPCTWRDGWPMLGDADGRVPEVMSVPNAAASHISDKAIPGIVHTDHFSSQTLDLEWQWNHNPIDSAWTLAERPGWLRLKTARLADNFFLAPNTLTTRMEGPQCEATIRLDVSRMADGDVAGFAALQSDAALLSVVCEGKRKYIIATKESVSLSNEHKEVTAVSRKEVYRQPLNRNIILLKIACDFRLGRDLATLSYSTDNGKTWHVALSDFQMTYDYRRLFMGTRFAIYHYAIKHLGGSVDVDSFDYLRGIEGLSPPAPPP